MRSLAYCRFQMFFHTRFFLFPILMPNSLLFPTIDGHFFPRHAAKSDRSVLIDNLKDQMSPQTDKPNCTVWNDGTVKVDVFTILSNGK